MGANNNPQVSVVIPAYNEDGNTPILCAEIHGALEGKYNHEVIFVDDGSTDGTSQELRELWRQGHARVLRLRRNFGQAAALGAGIRFARGDIIVTMDADLQNDPQDIPALVRQLQEGYDVVCGWRATRRDSFSKRVLSKGANWLRRKLTHEPVHDSGCTLRAYTRESLQGLELQGEMHRFIPALLYWRGYRVGEQRVNHRSRKYGKTKYGWARLGHGLLDLVLVAFWQRYSLRPIHMFGAIGFALTFLGGTVSAYLVFQRALFGTPLADRPLFILGLVTLIIGLQFFALGLLADILLRIYYTVRRQDSYTVEEFLE